MFFFWWSSFEYKRLSPCDVLLEDMEVLNTYPNIVYNIIKGWKLSNEPEKFVVKLFGSAITKDKSHTFQP